MDIKLKRKIDDFIDKEADSLCCAAMTYPAIQLCYIMHDMMGYSRRFVEKSLKLDRGVVKMIHKEIKRADKLLFGLYFTPITKEYIFQVIRKEGTGQVLDIEADKMAINYIQERAQELESLFSSSFDRALKDLTDAIHEYGIQEEKISELLQIRADIAEKYNVDIHPELQYGKLDSEKVKEIIECYAFDQIMYVLVNEKDMKFKILKRLFGMDKTRYQFLCMTQQNEELKSALFVSLEETSKVYDYERALLKYEITEQAVSYMKDINIQAFKVARSHYSKIQKDILDCMVKEKICTEDECQHILERIDMLIEYQSVRAA